jgi:polysaccharide biosynthesis protein PslG
MRKRKLTSLAMLLLMVLGLVLGTQSSLAANSPDEVPDSLPPFGAKFFPETGHTAYNGFLEYWNRTPNALFTLGFPISQPFIEESFTEPGKFYRVQYYERAVLEEHPENSGTQYYVLGRLMGNQLLKGREGEQPFLAIGNPGDGTWDELTGHTIRNSPAPFRSFYEQNGGLSVFGRPKSEQFQERNQATGETYWVQYYERNRMEWHPNEPDARYRVLLGLLGNEYRDAKHSGYAAFNPNGTGPGIGSGQRGVTPPRGNFVYGYNAILYGDYSGWQNRGRVFQLTKDSGFGWVRQQIRWMDLHDRSGAIYFDELDRIVADADSAGVELLLSVVAAPSWATDNGRNGLPNRANIPNFKYFMNEMAKRYKGRVAAYQIWNEQNLAVENGGRVASAALYMDVLEAGYDGVKSGDPGAIVVSGPPATTETNRPDLAISDLNFFRQMFADPRFRTHMDVIGVHTGGTSNPPDSMWPNNPGPGPNFVTSREFYFRRLEDYRALMLQYNLGDQQLWVTEFGWATRNNTPGYEFGNNTSLEEQAEWAVRAYQIARNEYSPWVGGMFLWNLNFSIPWTQKEGNPLHEQASFAIINGDWSPRPAYTALKNMQK